MIQELDKDIFDNGKLYRVRDYLFERINALPVGTEFTLKELLPPDYTPINALNQLGKEFAGLIQSGQWLGISIISENPNRYKKCDDLKKEGLFHQVNML